MSNYQNNINSYGCQVNLGIAAVMPMDCKTAPVKRFAWFVFVPIICVLVFMAPAFGGEALVVLDPGHGGRDEGVKGPNGTAEKTITLKLARIIAKDIEKRCLAILTRNDDFGIAAEERTSAANHHEAKAFVSLHTGGTFVRQADNVLVYYFEASSQYHSDGKFSHERSENDQSHDAWDEIQKPIKPASRILAGFVKKRLSETNKFGKIEIRGAPIPMLGGASMPAILIETGCLTNPLREKKLNDEKYLSELSDGIRIGIEDFLVSKDVGEKNSPQPFLDLHN